MVFHWSLSDSKSPQVSRTLLSILAVLSNAVIWIVSTRPPIFKSCRPFNNPFVIVPKVPITTGTIVTFMFHSFFNSLPRSRYLSFLAHSCRFILWSAGTAKSTILQILSFFFFFVNYYKVWSSGWDLVIKVPYEIIITIIIIIADVVTFRFFFILALVDSFSLESEYEQVSSCLVDSSQYSGRSQQCYSLDGFHSSSYFQILESHY